MALELRPNVFLLWLRTMGLMAALLPWTHSSYAILDCYDLLATAGHLQAGGQRKSASRCIGSKAPVG